MKKHILAVALIILMQFSMLVPAEAAAPDIKKVLTVFNSLGATNVNVDEDYSAEETVTRASFIDMTAKALGVAPSINSRYFADVPQDYWAAGSINAMYEMEVIDPAADRKFNPESPITYAQACKIIIYAAGYKNYAEYLTDDVSGYIRMAESMNIDIKVKDRDMLTFGEAVQLLYNGMCANIVMPSGINVSKPSHDKTMFSVYCGVYIKEGIITAIYGSTLDGSREVKDGYVRVGEEEYIIEDFSPDNLFGSYVEILYRENMDGTYTLLYAEQVSKRNEDIILSGDMIYGYNPASNTIRHFKTAEKKQVTDERLKGGIQIIYNGKPYGGSLTDIMNDFINEDRHGTIRLVDNDKESGYDLMIVKSYETFEASRFDKNAQVVYNGRNALRQLNLNNYEHLKVVNEYGNQIAFPEDMPVMLSVAESFDNKICEIIVCRNKVSGTLESVDLSEGIAILNGNSIKVSKVISSELINLRLDSTVTFLMDSFGFAVDVELLQDEMKIVYGIKVKANDDENGLVFNLTVYETDNAFHTYKFAKRVKIDGTVYKMEDYNKFFAAFPENVTVEENSEYIKVNFKRQVMRIRLNSDSEIAEVDTYEVYNPTSSQPKDNNLVRYHDGSEELIYNSHLKRFALDTLYSSSKTTLFIVPETDASGNIIINGIARSETADMYGVSKTFNHDYYYSIETYNFDSNNIYTDVIVLKQAPTMEETSVFMYHSKKMAINSDDEVLNQIVGYANGAKVTYFVDDTAVSKLANIKRGDIVKVVTNIAQTEVSDIIKMFDMETMTFTGRDADANWYAGTETGSSWQWNYRSEKYQLTKGRVLEVKNGAFKTTYNPVDLVYGIYDEIYNATNIPVVIYDSNETEQNRIRGGNLDDVLDYKSAGMRCSTALVNLQSGVLKQVFIYK